MASRFLVTTQTVSLPSFAKINLGLRILGKRPDGYHQVETVLQTVSLHDDLHFEATTSNEIDFSCDTPQIPTDSSNLVIRAAQALRDSYGTRAGASIRLEKRIPVQGGLGGGSSNAAIALLGLSRLWNLNTSQTDFHHLAARLGADVPFFLEGGCALATGIGTDLRPLADGPPTQVLIVAPQTTVSTADAYEALNAPPLTTSDSASILAISRTEADFTDSDQWPLCDHWENDFERVIFDIEPEIRHAKEAILQVGARCALLSGSGSAVFGVFESEEALSSAASALQLESGSRVFSCVTLSRVEYARALSLVALGR